MEGCVKQKRGEGFPSPLSLIRSVARWITPQQIRPQPSEQWCCRLRHLPSKWLGHSCQTPSLSTHLSNPTHPHKVGGDGEEPPLPSRDVSRLFNV